MFELNTKRLRLIPLDFESLKLLQKGRPVLEAGLGLEASGMQFSKEIAQILAEWMDFTCRNPQKYQWGTNWEIVLKAENKSVGSIGLNGFPDEKGVVTVGYTLDEPYQGRGLATEALSELANWVFAHREVNTLKALTPKENIASQKVLKKNHFKMVGEAEEEGMQCFVWELKSIIRL